MAQKLFVAGLSFNTTNEGLGAYFGRSGTAVSATIVTDQFSGCSHAFCVVEVETREEAPYAVATLNGSEVDGRTLKVEIARPKRDARLDGAQGGLRQERQARRLAVVVPRPICRHGWAASAGRPCGSAM